jgi:hypothetical protein
MPRQQIWFLSTATQLRPVMAHATIEVPENQKLQAATAERLMKEKTT